MSQSLSSPLAHSRIPTCLIGREAELRLARACMECGRNLLLEGPVGVGKSVLALHLLGHLNRVHVRVDGDERYTEQKMAGWFDPPLVLQKGYAPEHFIPGPLYKAMSEGGVLFINEINRLPESVQNLLLPALDERLITVPHLGSLHARDGFSVIATMNPREFIATSELTEALRDRFEIVYLEYQSAEEESAIVKVNIGPDADAHEALVEKAVAITRRTRHDPRVRRGASVRAAIAIVDLALKLGGESAVEDASRLALPNRMELREEADGQILDVIDEIVRDQKKKTGFVIPAFLTPKASGRKPPLSSRTEPVTDALQQVLGALPGGKDDDALWDLSIRYHDMRTRLAGNKPLRDWVRYLAIQGIIRRALAVLHSTRRPEKSIRVPMTDFQGELLLEESLENLMGKPYPDMEDLYVLKRVPIPLDVVMMLDTSLSMTGKKLALSAVAAVILAHQCEADGYSVIGFEGRATVIKPLRSKMPLPTVVGRILDVPALGFTNIRDGLGKGAAQLDQSRRPRRVGVLLSDGKATEGGCPLQAAARFRKLHVIMTEDFNMDRRTCHRIAENGGGLVFPLAKEDELPRVFYRVIRHALR